MTKIYKITTFGCQMNLSDSERIDGIMKLIGFKKTAGNNFDILIFNTCSIRQAAEDRVFGLNKKIKLLKVENQKLKVILTGCMMHYGENLLKKRLPNVDYFIDIKNIARLYEILKTKKQKNSLINSGYKKIIKEYLSLEAIPNSKFSALVPISYGCNNFCSYCVVPYSRGREYSRPANEIIIEVKKLINRGYKEIWLLGQNVNSYRYQVKGEKIIKFPDLLKLINNIPGNFWIRFTSPHPKDFSDDLIKVITECEKVAEYINLPIQSGSNKILKKMNRHYTAAHYLNLIKKIKKAMPEIAISTDTIIGFPGETFRDFKDTVDIYKKVKFDIAYIAKYSPRPKTLSAKLYKDNISLGEKNRRLQELTKVLAKTALKNNKKYKNKIVEVLVEKYENGKLFGHTRTFKLVGFEGSKSLIGNFADVKITGILNWGLIGKLKV